MHHCNFRLLIVPLMTAACIAVLSGCSFRSKMVVWAARPIMNDVILSILSETDMDLARTGLEADLKLLEGMIRTRPDDRQLLVLAAQGFSGYAMMFLENSEPERARTFYERGREYGMLSLSLNVKELSSNNLTLMQFREAVRKLKRKDIPAAYWTAVAWLQRINLERTSTSSLAESHRATSLMEWVLEREPHFYYSGPLWFFGTYYASLPPLMGGSSQEALGFFERALDADGDHFLWGKLLFARYYAVQTLDKNLYVKLLNEVMEGSPNEPDELRLLNRIAAVKAEELLERVDEFF